MAHTEITCHPWAKGVSSSFNPKLDGEGIDTVGARSLAMLASTALEVEAADKSMTGESGTIWEVTALSGSPRRSDTARFYLLLMTLGDRSWNGSNLRPVSSGAHGATRPGGRCEMPSNMVPRPETQL